MDTIKSKEILIVYFSWSGNTKAVAEEIYKQAGGDLYSIVLETPYSENYNATVAKARQEQQSNARPAIKTRIANIEQYDIVFLGYPNWCGSYPMTVATFVESNKLDGKIIMPFFTHGGGGVQRCDSDLRKLLSNAKICPYLILSGSSANSAQGEIAAWLKKAGF